MKLCKKQTKKKKKLDWKIRTHGEVTVVFAKFAANRSLFLRHFRPLRLFRPSRLLTSFSLFSAIGIGEPIWFLALQSWGCTYHCGEPGPHNGRSHTSTAPLGNLGLPPVVVSPSSGSLCGWENPEIQFSRPAAALITRLSGNLGNQYNHKSRALAH